jgi:hypothetical protein
VAGLAFEGAQAAKSKGSIEADSGRAGRAEAEKLVRSIGTAKRAPSAAFATRPPYGPVAAVSTKKLAGFPISGKSFMILSTGDVRRADNPNDSGSESDSAGGPPIRGARDVTIFRVNVKVPRGANCLRFRFRFLSEEFPEFVDKQYNDGFIAELDRTTWDTNTIGSPVISAPRNFAQDLKGNPINVNSVGDASVSAARAKGTTYDGATRRLRASTPVTPGNHRLYLSIFDQGDREWDSAVFIDRLGVGKSSACKTGAVRD